MDLSDNSLRRDWIVALAWVSTTAWLAAQARLVQVGNKLVARRSALPRAADANDSTPVEGLGRLSDVAESEALRGDTLAFLHRAAADELDAAENDFLELVVAMATLLPQPLADTDIEPAEPPEPAREREQIAA
jgi:hypothetical protein